MRLSIEWRSGVEWSSSFFLNCLTTNRTNQSKRRSKEEGDLPREFELHRRPDSRRRWRRRTDRSEVGDWRCRSLLLVSMTYTTHSSIHVLFFLVYSILCLHFSALPWFVISTTRILDTHLALHKVCIIRNIIFLFSKKSIWHQYDNDSFIVSSGSLNVF